MPSTNKIVENTARAKNFGALNASYEFTGLNTSVVEAIAKIEIFSAVFCYFGSSYSNCILYKTSAES